MQHFDYLTENTCSQMISFDLEDNRVHNISFMGGCNGNLKAIPILLEGMSVDEVISKLDGLQCGRRGTSCADQLCRALKEATNA